MSRGISRVKQLEWRGRLDRFAVSEQSVVAFCELERVSTASFYHWQKRLRNSAGDASAPDRSRFQELRVANGEGSLNGNMTETSKTVIRLGAGVSIQLGNDLLVAELVVKQLLAATVGSAREAKSC